MKGFWGALDRDRFGTVVDQWKQTGFLTQDLAYATFVDGADLSGMRLDSLDLAGTHMANVNLRGASLRRIKLGRYYYDDESDDPHAYADTNLAGADLTDADLRGAVLSTATLSGCKFHHVWLTGEEFKPESDLVGIDWGDYKVRQEVQGLYSQAEQAYRILAHAYRVAGLEDTASEFHYREQECRRKGTSYSGERVRLTVEMALLGYGERPLRLAFLATVVILVFAFAMALFGGLRCEGDSTCTFLDALHLSAVSFSAVGYGGWAATPNWIGRWLGVFESGLGVMTIALFVSLVFRKLTR